MRNKHPILRKINNIPALKILINSRVHHLNNLNYKEKCLCYKTQNSEIYFKLWIIYKNIRNERYNESYQIKRKNKCKKFLRKNE